jgi:tetratricopeptide (TPR) repeat protein
MQMHRAGQLGPAAELYQNVLAREPENADALHLLGVLRHQQGDHARAVQLISRAVSLRPGMAAFHANLAAAYRATGQLDRAVECCHTALRLQPDFPDALLNLGVTLRDQGQLDAALTQFQAVLRVRPEFALAHNNLADVLRDLGRRPEAIEHYRRAVRCDPNYIVARSNLGQLLLEQGELDEALLHGQAAARLQPNSAEARNRLGNVYRARGQSAEARACYAEALRLNPTLAATPANMGQVAQDEGRLEEALAWYDRALRMEPKSPRFHCYVGSVHERLENYEEAVRCYELALNIDPAYAEAHNRLGTARSEQGRLAEAREHFAAALQLRPDFHAARGALGQVLQELGDLAGSEDEFRQILERNPRHATALAALATLLRGKLPQADRLLIERRLAERELPDAARSDLLFAVAAVRDADGDYAKAAEHLEQANALALARRNRLGQGYDPASHARTVDAMIAACTPDFFGRVRSFGLETERPVFIMGLPRSGTTLTEQILAAHSQACGAGELHWVRESFLTLADIPADERAIGALVRADREAVERTARRHLERLQGLNATAARVVDKMPDNYLYLGFLAALFPRAKFIHCRRDLRDVAVSCWSTNFRSTAWTCDPDHIVSRLELYLRVMNHWRAVLPVPVLDVDYEETVSDLEGMARRLVAWCGLEWEPACLAFHEGKRPVRTASVAQVRQPVYRSAAGRWKNYEGALAPLLRRVEGLITSPPAP